MTGYLSQDTPLCDLAGITVYSDHIQFADVHIPFTVPASVGGAGRLYALRLQVLQADGSVYGDAATLDASNEFFLTNTTGRSQLFSTVYAPAAYIPCSSLSCVNSCFDDLFGVSTNFSSESTSTAECANKCAGISDGSAVDIPSDWLEVASSASAASTAVQVLSTVPAGTATACFVSGTGSASGAASTAKNAAGGVQELLSKSWVLAAGAMLAAL